MDATHHTFSSYEERENKPSPLFSNRRHSSPFPLRFNNLPFEPSTSMSISNSQTMQGRSSIEETNALWNHAVALSKRQQDMEPRRSERNKRRKSVDTGTDAYIPDEEEEEEEEEEFVPQTPPRVERAKPRKGRRKSKFECAGKDKCALCKNGAPYYLHKSMNPGWRETLLAVFEYFPKRVTVRQWKMEQNLLTEEEIEAAESTDEVEWLYLPDSYGFLEYHWDILCPPQHYHRARTTTNWRKTLQDTLSHNRTYFISGKEIFGRTGFWRLYERAPSPSQHLSERRNIPREPLTSLFSSPVTVDSFFTIPEPYKPVPVAVNAPAVSRSNENSLKSSSDENSSYGNNGANCQELQLLLEAIDCIQRI